MTSLKFEETTIKDQFTQKNLDAVAVLRNGKRVAVLPEADRLRRALNLPVDKIQNIIFNFAGIMGRNPSSDEREFWKAVLEYKRAQERKS